MNGGEEYLIPESAKDQIGSNGRITYRDVNDAMARVERELRDGQARLEGKLDAYILSHAAVHSTEQNQFNQHLVTSAVMGEKGKVIDSEMHVLKSEVESLREWRAEMRGMANLVKFAVGTSLVGAVVSIITLLTIIQNFLR